MRKTKIIDIYDVRRQTGEVGIEIEMEGKNLTLTHEHGHLLYKDEWLWDFKADGSLRGESCEWVLNKPVPRDRVNTVLSHLWSAKVRAGGTFAPSRRCGVHIHMNVQQLTEKQVFNLICTYIAFEPVLVRWVGEDREGNLFCLRASDAREQIESICRAKQHGTTIPLLTDMLRYASLNVGALNRYGSLEFRALGTPAEPQKIKQWINLLYSVRDLSLEFKEPRDLLYHLSANDSREMVMRVFGPRTPLRNMEELDGLLREGMRNLQDIILTAPSAYRNVPNLPRPGAFHVVDPNDPNGWLRAEMEDMRNRNRDPLEELLREDDHENDFLEPPMEEDDEEDQG